MLGSGGQPAMEYERDRVGHRERGVRGREREGQGVSVRERQREKHISECCVLIGGI